MARFAVAHEAGKYTYERFEYKGQHELSIITCTRHGDFLMSAANHGTRHGCTSCNNNAASREENLWIAAIESRLGETAERSVRVSSRRGATLDAVFGKVAVEYDGAYWHALPGALEKDVRKTATAISDGLFVIRIRAADPKHPPLPDVPNARNIHVGNSVSAAGLTAVINAIREARK
jgi:very-short-patch-repair endonuclease